MARKAAARRPAGQDLDIRWVPIDDVKPYDRNPRRNEAAVDKVATSLGEYGWRQPIVVDADLVVIAGHTRLRAAEKLGHEVVPVSVAAHLSEQQVKAFRIADNRVAQDSEWDEELLALELGELRIGGFDLGLTGFDADDLQNLGKLNVNETPEAPILQTASRSLTVTVPPKLPEEIAKACAAAGESRNEWIVCAIRRRLEEKGA